MLRPIAARVRGTTWSSSSRAASRSKSACRAYESASLADTDCGASDTARRAFSRAPSRLFCATSMIAFSAYASASFGSSALARASVARASSTRPTLNSTLARRTKKRASRLAGGTCPAPTETPEAGSARNTGPTARHPVDGRRSAAAPVRPAPAPDWPLVSVRLP